MIKKNRKTSIAQTVKKLLESDLSLHDRNLLTSALINKLEALPARDIITANEQGVILVNDRPLTQEQSKVLKESALALYENSYRKVIRDCVSWKAITHGIHKSSSIEGLIFSKAAVWWGQQEEVILKNIIENLGTVTGTADQINNNP